VAASVDRALIGQNHLWAQSKTWDPEGPLSTVPAIATGLLGIMAAPWVRERRVRELSLIGAAGLIAGKLWDFAFPINKALWTSSYVIFTAGFACVLLALCIWLIDLKGVKGWTKPFEIYGVNPMLAFIGSGVMARVLGMAGLQSASYKLYYAPYFSPKLASLLWGLSFVLLWLGILAIFYRKRWILKI